MTFPSLYPFLVGSMVMSSVQVGGASHAFFDGKPDDTTKATFEKYGVYYAAVSSRDLTQGV
jgi:hypothetical protein